mmetsp:Transcript_2263/g.5224  ORF Transcript_2263/g.5224 Transcript_2263/m.5224 type:complete len:665 (-) Transcript_2263:213-2207(-)
MPSYEYSDVKLRVGKVWVSGSLSVTSGVGETLRLVFKPTDSTEAHHGFSATRKELIDEKLGNNMSEYFIQVLRIVPGRNKPKKCTFNFGARQNAALTVRNELTKAATTTSQQTSAGGVQNQSSGGPGMSVNTGSSQPSGEYFEKYGRPLDPSSVDIEDDPDATPQTNLARRQLLETNPDLLAVYMSTVPALMTVKEFWEAREDQVQEEKRSVMQFRGLSTGLTADVEPAAVSRDEINYVLTPEVIKRIFLEHRRVHRLYQEKVQRTKEFSEERFWHLYFFSRYHPPMWKIGPEMLASDDVQAAISLFGDFDDEEDMEDLGKKHIITFDNHGNHPHDVPPVAPNVDLLQTLNDNPRGAANELAAVGMADRAGFGIAQRDPGEEEREAKHRRKLQRLGRKVTIDDVKRLDSLPVESGPLMSRYNRHAKTVLPDEESEGHRLRAAKRIRRMKESEKKADTFHDLEEAGGIRRGPQPVPLQLNEQLSAYIAVGGAAVAKPPAAQASPAQEIASDVIVPSANILEWNSGDLRNVLPKSSVAVDVLRHVLGSNNERGADENVTEVSQLTDHNELLRVFRACNEIRRQFWTSFQELVKHRDPRAQSALLRRVQSIVEKLKLIQQRNEDFRNYARENSNSTVAMFLLQIRDQLQRAIDTWHKYETKVLNKQS